MNNAASASDLFRRALLVLLAVEIIFLVGVIGAGVIFGRDANGGTYWKESVQIASFALFALALPALALAYLGKWALLAATPLAAFAAAICLFPYIGIAFDLSTATLLKLGAVITLVTALFARVLARRNA